MEMNYCMQCGTKLHLKHHDTEGDVPFCDTCGAFRYPVFNTAVSMVVTNPAKTKVILIKQYGRPHYILVAGYVNRGETVEHAVCRELKEEMGLTAHRIAFNRTSFFEPSNTLMCNFTAYVADDHELHTNNEIDAYAWFTPDEARRHIRPDSLAEWFLNAFLSD